MFQRPAQVAIWIGVVLPIMEKFRMLFISGNLDRMFMSKMTGIFFVLR